MYSDAAFKKEEEEDRHSMRGSLFIRCAVSFFDQFRCTTIGHLIDFIAKQQRRVVRATFTAELQAGCDTVDRGLLLAQTFHVIETGENTATASRYMRLHGGFSTPMILYLDAMSVYAALTATFIKTPAEQGMLCHFHFLRELLEHDVLHAVAWTDTRDMLADGTTKGSVDRTAIHDVMNGDIKNSHELKLCDPRISLKVPLSQQPLSGVSFTP